MLDFGLYQQPEADPLETIREAVEHAFPHIKSEIEVDLSKLSLEEPVEQVDEKSVVQARWLLPYEEEGFRFY